RGPEAGTRRASRGGSWRHQVKASRCAARSAIPPGLRYSDYGFRLAVSTPAPGCPPEAGETGEPGGDPR
ncbi:MAG TPA: SUMF1/EgtB/PvdO family nonheme iron enzyme, partial [Thermoanaerobaculia bacterium]|nr:SUMF1/EgtB/PvdO family nonheme iron enzyme [Thermoanaerobaculia bacterium]